MTAFTSKGISYPEADDFIKLDSDPAKLASDMRGMAVTTDAAIGNAIASANQNIQRQINRVDAAAQGYADDAYTNAVAEAERMDDEIYGPVDARLAVLEQAAGFPDPPLGYEDEVVSGLIHSAVTETRAALDANYLRWRNSTVKYVDPVNGDDTQGGTSTTPYRTVGRALEEAEAEAQRAETQFRIVLTAGTYTERVRTSDWTAYNLNVQIEGPNVGGHPSVPTAVFSEASTGTSAVAITSFNPQLRLTVQDVKFVGYNGTTASAGIQAAYNELFTVNVHAENCMFGISSQKGNLDVKGGILDNCGRLSTGSGTGAAIRSLMLNRHAVGFQQAGNLGFGPVIRNSRYGLMVQEGSTGHSDYVTYEDNELAVVIRVNARVNLNGSSFIRNGRAVDVEETAHVYVAPNVVFGTGADANTTAVFNRGGAYALTTLPFSFSTNAQRNADGATYAEYDEKTLTGSTTATTMFTRTLGAPWWDDSIISNGFPGKVLKLKVSGRNNGSAGTKTMQIRIGGTLVGGIVLQPSENGSFVFEGEIVFTGKGSQVYNHKINTQLGNSRCTTGRAAIDMSVDRDLTFIATNSSASDEFVIDYFELGQ